MNDTIKARIAEADLILIGIGEEFAVKRADIEAHPDYCALMQKMNENKERLAWMFPFIQKDFTEKYKDENIEKAYEALQSLLEGKNYFIITENTDDRIFHSALHKDRIVAPCGNLNYLQCDDNCCHELLNAQETAKNIIAACRMTDNDLEQPVEPKCPHCGSPLVFNTVKAASYEQSSYLPMWEKYMLWLQGTLNKKVCMIELGVGFSYPTIIRWPFEKIGFLNQKAEFIRVHHSLYQLSEELKEKGISIAENSVDFIRNTFVY